MDEEAPAWASDDALLARAAAGDGAAFAKVVLRYQPALRRFAYRLFGRLDLADDLVQETLLRAFTSLASLREPERFGAWLFGIAANLARWWWRRQALWPVSLDGLAREFPDIAWAHLSGPALPEEVVEEAEQRRRLLAAVAALPPSLAQVLTLHYLDGLSYAEIAAALHVPVSTVKGRLFKSRALLRRTLGAEEGATSAERRRKRPPAHWKGRNTVAAAPSTLVRVTVERVLRPWVEATPERVRRWLEHAIRARAEDQPRPDLGPVAERVAPILAAAGVLLDMPDCGIRLRAVEGDGRWLAFQVGLAEAFALALHVQGRAVPRPISHDLMRTLVDAGGVQVEKVAVTREEQGTYYATMALRRPDGSTLEVDARPSDAVNLAVRVDAPIFVAAHLLQPPEAATPSEAAP